MFSLKEGARCCHPESASILLSATTKGVFSCFRISMHSTVCSMMPSRISMTKITRSAKLPPLRLRFVKAAWPGVSISKNPGIPSWILNFFRREEASFSICSAGSMVQEMRCVIEPASFFATLVPLILSKREVFPWSTCPATVTIGWRILPCAARHEPCAP